MSNQKLSVMECYNGYLNFPWNGKMTRVYTSEILMVNSHGDYVEIETEEKSYMIHGRLKTVESALKGHGFFKVHRSHIVQLDAVTDVYEDSIYIGGKEVPVSRSNRKKLLRTIPVLH